MDTGRAFSLGSCCSVLAGPQARSVCTFSQDGFGLETDRGSLSLQSVSNDSISPHRPTIVKIFLDDRWIIGAVGKLLWLPLIYQSYCSEVRNSTVFLGHKSGQVTFIEFDLSQLPPIIQT